MADTERESLSIRVPRVVKYLSRPLTSATLFYALYILGDERLHCCHLFAQRLKTFSEDFAKALYDYGICMITRELCWCSCVGFYPGYIAKAEYIAPDLVESAWREIYEDAGEAGVREKVVECINKAYPRYFPGKHEAIRMFTTGVTKCIIERIRKRSRIVGEPTNMAENARWVRGWLEHYQKIKNPYFWIAAERILRITDKGCKGWIEGFGGEYYAAIADVMRQYDRLTPIAFVDLCCALEHWTGAFIWRLAVSPEEMHFVRCFLREGEDIYEVGIKGALRRLFDAARRGSEEDVRLILRCATSARQDWVAFGFVDIGKASNPPAGLRLRQLRMQSEAFLRRIVGPR